VVYSVDDAYASTTQEADTNPRVTSHSDTVDDLVACATYHYKVVSADAASNYATSTADLFTTAGCTGGATPSAATSTDVSVNAAATSTITDSGHTLTVSTPANVTATSSSIVIQIKGLSATPVLDSIGKPSSALSSAASIVFDVIALVNNTTVLDSFDSPVTISYTYTDADIDGLDESSLKMYHYHDGAWLVLDNCSVDAATNTITCTTPSFSTFAIFGSSATTVSASTSAGNAQPWCSGTSAPGWNASLPDGGCGAPANSSAPSATTPTLADCNFTRDLDRGMRGPDVLCLQQYLNAHGESLAQSGPGSPGEETDYFGSLTFNTLVRFQEAYAAQILAPLNLSKGTGYFGVSTRSFVNGH
jgi:hypothetical protein